MLLHKSRHKITCPEVFVFIRKQSDQLPKVLNDRFVVI